MSLFIIDIDGTLADFSHRRHLVEGQSPDWDAFMSPELMIKDAPVPHALSVLNKFRKHNYEMCFLTGRRDSTREVTEHWLTKNMDWDRRFEPVYMRTPEYSNMHASIYKKKQLSQVLYTHSMEGSRSPLIFFEDDPFVARMYRDYGMVCKAPECWEFWDHGLTEDEEPLWRF